jgi:hypothetical protein
MGERNRTEEVHPNQLEAMIYGEANEDDNNIDDKRLENFNCSDKLTLCAEDKDSNLQLISFLLLYMAVEIIRDKPHPR